MVASPQGLIFMTSKLCSASRKETVCSHLRLGSYRCTKLYPKSVACTLSKQLNLCISRQEVSGRVLNDSLILQAFQLVVINTLHGEMIGISFFDNNAAASRH
jgi:hypothetical protein